jgi:hypothetical protein
MHQLDVDLQVAKHAQWAGLINERVAAKKLSNVSIVCVCVLWSSGARHAARLVVSGPC